MTDIQLTCPHCDEPVNEADLFSGVHESGCGEGFELYTDDATGETVLKAQ